MLCKITGAAGVFIWAVSGAVAPALAAGDVDRLSVSAGWFDIFDDEDSAEFRLEYRFGKSFLGFIKPWVGAEANLDGGLYGGGGVLADIRLGERIVVTPSFGVGLYSDGNSKDLGNSVGFRSQIEIGYEFDNQSRVSLGISHTSNAHLNDKNPGVEVAMIYYHIPVGALLGD